MTRLLLDTNIVSYFIKAHHLRERYRPLLRADELAISFMTIAELYQGAYQENWGQKRFNQLHRVIGYYIVVQSSIELGRVWGELRASRKERPISVQDAWIAATALSFDAPLVTHNPKHFRGIRGLQVITAES